ncbi:MAG TPA: flagellar hook capping FlgD N-terminal domain-containing protein [Gemmatimonadales bacterium]|jgi:flagellar basal-body rod modification protein FlgD|nr:flagellar hook capping FlgD N-terminal domain-containing protein [Gemmatimonadales bacterium]
MTAPVTNSPLVTNTAPTTSAADAGDPTDGQLLGENDFLQLLVTQMKNQDPMNPMDGTQLATQLAQFSTVEQLITLNSKMDAQTSATTQAQLAQQEQFGASLIGRSVVTDGANVTVADGQTPTISVDLASAAQTLHVDVIGSDGSVVGSQDFTNVASGSSLLNLNLDKVSAGTYTYKVTATDSSGAAVTATGSTVSQVLGTLFQNGQVMLQLSSGAVAITDISEILPAAGTAASTTTQQ